MLQEARHTIDRTSHVPEGEGAFGLHLEEALARCEHLVETRRRFGLVVGPAGTGKSHLLQRLAATTRRMTAPEPVCLDMTYLDGAALVRELAEALAAGRPGGDWRDLLRPIRDRLEGLAACEASQVLLLDHLDAARPEAWETVSYLLRAVGRQRCLTVIATARAPLTGRLVELQRDFGWLRIELAPLNEGQTMQAARQTLRQAGRHDHTLAGGAAHALYEITAGNPRQVQRLVELALLANEADQAESVSAETLHAVAHELAIRTIG